VSSPRPVASKPRKKQRRSKEKSLLRQYIEFYLAYSFLTLIRWIPYGICKLFSALLGEAVFWLLPRRRRIALTNLEIAFPEMSESERRRVARASCRSFILTGFESVKYIYRSRVEDSEREMRRLVKGVEAVLDRARKVHEEAGGCIFVIPHLGNWEYLSHASAAAEIPVTIVVRPLDNPRLEKHLFEMRASSGQEILAKRNSLFHLRTALRKGRSVGLLADQHAGMKGIDVPFFGKPASTTTGPGALAVSFGRPVMLVACLRSKDGDGYEGLLSEPSWPDQQAESVKEIERITIAVNREIEKFVRERPEQYLWIHDRWKLTKLWGRSESFLAQKAKEKNITS
jgi:KDO2-lipid IV(A) lauroyltransferase